MEEVEGIEHDNYSKKCAQMREMRSPLLYALQEVSCTDLFKADEILWSSADFLSDERKCDLVLMFLYESLLATDHASCCKFGNSMSGNRIIRRAA
jgi:hypothetical protein